MSVGGGRGFEEGSLLSAVLGIRNSRSLARGLWGGGRLLGLLLLNSGRRCDAGGGGGEDRGPSQARLPSLQLLDMKIFVDTDSDIRLVRRLRRDISERGREIEGVIKQYNKFVKPAFDQYIQPTMRLADIVVPRGRCAVFLGLSSVLGR